MTPAHLAVLAKEPRPGFAKTRLSPPCTPLGAATVAEASLAATLQTVRRTPAAARTLVLDGEPGPWLPRGFEIEAQAAGDLDARLTAAFEVCLARGAPVVLVGMDTPQLRPSHLLAAAAALRDHDAVVGPAFDGGYWLVGLRWLHPNAFSDVPMSTAATFTAQYDRLVKCGYTVAVVEALRDVDTMADAREVAALAPSGRFARAVAAAAAPVAVSR